MQFLVQIPSWRDWQRSDKLFELDRAVLKKKEIHASSTCTKKPPTNRVTRVASRPAMAVVNATLDSDALATDLSRRVRQW